MEIEINVLEQASGFRTPISSIATSCKIAVSNFNTLALDAEVRVKVVGEGAEEPKLKFDVFGYHDSPSGAMIAELEGTIDNTPSALPTDEIWIVLKVGGFKREVDARDFIESSAGRDMLDNSIKHLRVYSGYDGDKYEVSVS